VYRVNRDHRRGGTRDPACCEARLPRVNRDPAHGVTQKKTSRSKREDDVAFYPKGLK